MTPSLLPALLPALLAIGLLGSSDALARDDPPPQFPPLHFAAAVPLLFDLGSVAVEDRSAGDVTAGRIDQTMDLPPAAAVADWAAARLVAAGRTGSMTMIIREASAVEAALPVDGGLAGVFKDEEKSQLVARLVVDFVAERPDGSRAQATVTAVRQQTLLESTRPIDRRQALYDLSRDLIASFDAQATATIDQVFGAYR